MWNLNVIAAVQVLAVLGMLHQGAEAEQNDTAKRLLEQCLESYRQVHPMESHAKIESQIVAPFKAKGARHTRRDLMIRVRGEEFCLEDEFHLLDKEGYGVGHSKIVYNKEGFFRTDYVSPKEKRPKNWKVSTSKKEKFLAETFETPSYGMFLDGYVFGFNGKRVVEIMLSEGNLRSRGREVVKQQQCDVVYSNNRFGDITMWLNQELGCLPMKVRVEKKGESQYKDGKTLAQEATRNVEGKQLKVVGVSELIDDLRIAKIDDRFVTLAGRYVLTDHLQDGRDINYTIRCERTVQLKPQLKSSIDCGIDIPEDGPVTNLDDSSSGLIYVWQNGKVVLRSTDQLKPATRVQPRARRNILVWGFAAAFILGVTIWLLVKRAREAKQKP